MKHLHLCCVAILISSVMSLASCKSDSTPPGDNSAFDTLGSAYLPLQLNQVVSGHVRGAQRQYDVNGSLTSFDSTDNDHTAFVMGAAVAVGLPGFSIGVYNDRGDVADRGRPIVYIANSNGNVYASDHRNAEKALALPATLSDGLVWNPDSHGSPRFKAVLTRHLSSFTNQNGNTYSNVIQVEGTIADSSYEIYGSEAHVQVTDLDATIYFAKDVGPVQVNFHRYDNHHYAVDANGIKRYIRAVISGVIARNK